MKVVFVHKPDSPYKDIKGKQYHFPKMYLSRVEKSLGDMMVYYEKIRGEKGLFYTGTARVNQIRTDNDLPDHFYAEFDDFLDFDRFVPYRENNGYESKLIMSDGSINGGTAQSAVRLISDLEFARILEAGLSEVSPWPDREDDTYDTEDLPQGAFLDGSLGQPGLIDAPYDREIVLQLTNRKWRDRKFKNHVRVAYDRTCALTGLRLINGGGRPEVEAAHIRPVEHGGNDWIRNGIALSGTVHWMFDRGLLSLGDEFEILHSRKLNHDVSGLLRKEGRAKVPEREELRPHAEYLKWHRHFHGF